MSLMRLAENLLETLLYWIKDLFLKFVNFLISVFYFFLEWFLGLSIADKLIVFTGIPALIAIIFPSAKFRIFDSWHYINNPFSVSLIALVGLMALTLMFGRYINRGVMIFISALYFIYALFMLIAYGAVDSIPYFIIGALLTLLLVKASGFFILGWRVMENLFYFILVLKLWLSGDISKATPYIINWSYYVNFAVPLLYIIFSGISHVFGDNKS